MYRLHAVWSRVAAVDVNARRGVIARQFLELLIDLPFILLGVLSGWRLPFLLRDITLSWQLTSYDRRRAAAENFGLFVLDVPALFSFVVIAVTLYRFVGARGLWVELRRPATVRPWAVYSPVHRYNRFQTHTILLMEAVEWVVDLPFQALALVLLGTVWRAVSLIRRLFPEAQCPTVSCCGSAAVEGRPRQWSGGVAARRASAAAAAAGAGVDQKKQGAGVDQKQAVIDLKPADFSSVPKAVLQFVVWPYLDDRALHGTASVSKVWRELARTEARKRPPAVRVPLFGAPYVAPLSFRRVVWEEFVDWLIDIPFGTPSLSLTLSSSVLILNANVNHSPSVCVVLACALQWCWVCAWCVCRCGALCLGCAT